MPVLPGAEVRLGHRGQADGPEHIDQDPEFRPVAGQERDRRNSPGWPRTRPPAAGRTRSAPDRRSSAAAGHQLGDPAAASATTGRRSCTDAGRPPSELDPAVEQQGPERAVDESRRSRRVGVGEHDDVTARDGQARHIASPLPCAWPSPGIGSSPIHLGPRALAMPQMPSDQSASTTRAWLSRPLRSLSRFTCPGSGRSCRRRSWPAAPG